MVFRDKHPDHIRIGACADYLLGKSMHEIEQRWGVTIGCVSAWIKRTGSFKLRRIRKPRGDNHCQSCGGTVIQGTCSYCEARA